ncbi:hypothetical protein BABINDRAFT_154986 [Babjeviella inositovora NRRL Y-12698]|uniref:Uncharacterized protein n=1 Tax=Babjeviella inositovora NRRL Y-12698 TaxID=984486 RepID=A0A1E3QPL4_9ASCO|nr:uncharacterized protein BABINDRAFT_154986 [Babjeviella inositovora NRRL Y-12698]ODQ78917.1 hypothetical protein BABINDRAFT_154986 [Babjeviella inositovora NRRL Y-12698]
MNAERGYFSRFSGSSFSIWILPQGGETLGIGGPPKKKKRKSTFGKPRLASHRANDLSAPLIEKSICQRHHSSITVFGIYMTGS